jgi:hypothetical protein
MSAFELSEDEIIAIISSARSHSNPALFDLAKKVFRDSSYSSPVQVYVIWYLASLNNNSEVFPLLKDRLLTEPADSKIASHLAGALSQYFSKEIIDLFPDFSLSTKALLLPWLIEKMKDSYSDKILEIIENLPEPENNKYLILYAEKVRRNLNAAIIRDGTGL